MVNESIDLFSNSSQSLNTIDIDVLKEVINLLWTILHFKNQCSEKFNQIWIVVVNAEVQTVEQSHFVLLNVVRVLSNDVNYFSIE